MAFISAVCELLHRYTGVFMYPLSSGGHTLCKVHFYNTNITMEVL